MIQCHASPQIYISEHLFEKQKLGFFEYLLEILYKLLQLSSYLTEIKILPCLNIMPFYNDPTAPSCVSNLFNITSIQLIFFTKLL